MVKCFRINDRVISAGGASLEGVDYATAVQVLRDSGHSVNLVVKRRVVLPSPPEPIKYIFLGWTGQVTWSEMIKAFL